MKVNAVLIGLSAAFVAGMAQAEGAGSLKPGLWEVHILKMTLDDMDMLPSMNVVQEQMRRSMASLPSEQRKLVEAIVGEQDGDPTVQRICISAEMAKNGQAVVPLRPPHADCGEPKLTRSGNHMTFNLSCKQGSGMIETQMQFINSHCGDLKPVDQIAKAMPAAASRK
jgi:hypothetical protein